MSNGELGRYYFMWVIVVVGSISNLTAIIVIILSKRLRQKPSGVLLLSLTIVDTIVLISERVQTLTERNLGDKSVFLDEHVRIFIFYIKYSGRCAAGFIIACISINRFAAIVFPLKSDWFMQATNAVKQVILAVLVALVVNVYIIVWPPIDELDDHKQYFYGLLAVEFVLTDVIVSLCILVLSALTIRTLLRRQIQEHSINDQTSQQRTKQVTILLLVVALTYVTLRVQYKVVWIPVYFTRFITKAPGEPYGKIPDGLATAYYVTYCFFILNHATNLYQYCLCSREFRKELLRIFHLSYLAQSTSDPQVPLGPDVPKPEQAAASSVL